jgi:hypothetical protein
MEVVEKLQVLDELLDVDVVVLGAVHKAAGFQVAGKNLAGEGHAEFDVLG